MKALCDHGDVILNTYEVVISCGTAAEAKRLAEALNNDGFRARAEHKQMVSKDGQVTVKRKTLRG